MRPQAETAVNQQTNQSEPSPTIATINPESHYELRDFSRRYSPMWRSEVAGAIVKLRAQHREKHQGDREKSLNIALSREEIAGFETRKAEILGEIENANRGLIARRDAVTSRIADWINNKISKGQDVILAEKIGSKEADLTTVTADIAERYALIDETETAMNDTSELDEAKSLLNEFYASQSGLKNQLNEEQDVRDVAKLSEQNNLVFIHGVPLRAGRDNMRNTVENNPTVSVVNADFRTKLDLLLSLQPTISASAVSIAERKSDDIDSFYPAGVVLAGGTVLAAYQRDIGTFAYGLYTRGSKYDHEVSKTTIQPNIREHIAEAIEPSEKVHMTGKHNEIVVENPKPAGLYIELEYFEQLYQSNNSLRDSQLAIVTDYAKEAGLPVYYRRGGKFYDNPDGLTAPLTFKDIHSKARELEMGERAALAEKIIEEKPFVIKSHEQVLFNHYKLGIGRYEVDTQYKNPVRAQIERMTFDEKVNESITLIGEFLESSYAAYQERKDGPLKTVTFRKQMMQNWLYELHGYAEAARQNNDAETVQKVAVIFSKYAADFGSENSMQQLMAERTDESGGFKVLDRDIPLEVKNAYEKLKQ